jgi:phage major head subunit gpT-like protein
MLINRPAIDALNTSFSAIYGEAWRNTPMWGPELAMQVPSSTRTNTYGWMKRLLKMRKWDGPRLIQNLDTHSYLLENDPYELTVGVKKWDILDDQLGVFNPMVQEMGRQGAKWQDQTLKTVLQSGTTALCFDGQPFFSATHPLDPAGNQNNNFAVTPLNATNWATVRATMRSYTGEDGEPLAVNPNLLIVPPQLDDTANTLVTLEYGASGASNVQKGQARVLVVPEFANQPDTWYVADTSSPIKPLVWQLRAAIQFAQLTNVTDDNVFMLAEFLWGLEGRGVGGFGPWFLMARAKNT